MVREQIKSMKSNRLVMREKKFFFTRFLLAGTSNVNHNLVSCCCGFINANDIRLSPADYIEKKGF